jgi:DNA-binding transcriptional MerR regulator
MRVSIEDAGHAVQLFHPGPSTVYNIEALARLTRVPRRTILLYCKHHLVSPVGDVRWGNYYFDHETVQRLRNIENIRARFGVNIDGLKFIFRLLEEMERLRYEHQMFAE